MSLEILQNSQENTYARASFKIDSLKRDFIKKETLTQVFSCEFCKISKTIFFIEHLWATASQPARDIPGIFAECSLSVTMFGTAREHFKEKDFIKSYRWKICFCIKSVLFHNNQY